MTAPVNAPPTSAGEGTADGPGGALTTGVDRDARRALVEGARHPLLNGIDFVEVLTNRPDAPDHVPGAPQQRTLAVHLLRGPVPDGLGTGPGDPRVSVRGGVRPDPRVNPVRVVWAYPAAALTPDPAAAPLPPGVTDDDRVLVGAAVPEHVRPRVLVVRTSTSGDWSTYVLRMLGTGGRGVPDGFDEPLAQAPFSFTVDCPSELDCGDRSDTVTAVADSPALDYLARDYTALRTRLLDRLAVLLPEWTDRSPADIGVTLVELFAHLGDRLAYWQDAVADEAYLSTARRRTSIRRHARLLDYRMHDGCSARVWLTFTTDSTVDLPAGTPVTDGSGQPGLDTPTVEEAVEGGAIVFETCGRVRLTPARNHLLLHAWQDHDRCLPAGATSAFVNIPEEADPQLRAGDVLILAELSPLDDPGGGDPTRRYAVRLDRDPVEHIDPYAPSPRVLELHWHGDDALPGPMRISRGTPGRPEPAAAALANTVLADHGASVTGEVLLRVPLHDAYRPYLARTGLTRAEPAAPAPPDGTTAATGWRSATAALRPDPHSAEPQLELDDGMRRWHPRPDLLSSGRLDPHVVVESEPGGAERLRFGDNITGRRPTPGTTMTARYRVGCGARGNVGSDTLTRLLRTGSGLDRHAITVSNPLPAAGGTDPQPADEVRALAPHAFRTQLRAITSADYAAVAMEDGAVQRAVARRRWTGSWYAQEVVVDPTVTATMDPGLPVRLTRALETRRMAGVDVGLGRPLTVPLEIRLSCCVAPGYLRPEAERQLRDVLGAQVLPDGRRGLFHPDNLTVGRPVLLSDLVAAAMSVPGINLVEVQRFGRMGADAAETAASLARGRLDAAPREVLCCDSDPDRPESGRVDLILRGGS